MVLISIYCKRLIFTSQDWRESSTEVDFPTAETGGQKSYWAWYTVMFAKR